MPVYNSNLDRLYESDKAYESNKYDLFRRDRYTSKNVYNFLSACRNIKEREKIDS